MIVVGMYFENAKQNLRDCFEYKTRENRVRTMTKRVMLSMALLLVVSVSAFAAGPGPAPVNLRSAGDFVILTKSGITDVPTSAVTGDVGTSPITGAADLLTCTEVTGIVVSVNAAGPAPCSMKNPTRLTAAVLDMQTAYTDAAGRPNPDVTELGRGILAARHSLLASTNGAPVCNYRRISPSPAAKTMCGYSR
jgi:Ice-binding-like